MRRWAPRVRPGRLTGVDVARGLAVFGMLYVHFAPDQTDLTLADGRSSILFATLAGVSLGLLTGGASPPAGRVRLVAYRTIAIRAVVLIVLGRLLWSLNTTIAVILDYYGFLFLVLLPLLFASRIALGCVVVFSVSAGALLVQGAKPDLSGAFNSPNPLAWPGQWFLTGFYPGALFAAYVAIGLVCARSDLRRLRTQLVMVAGGTLSAIAGYGIGGLLGIEVYAHSDSTWEALGSGGFAVALIGLLQLVARLRLIRLLLSPIEDVGSMPLTVYTGQVIALAVLFAAPRPEDQLGQFQFWPWLAALAAGSLLFAILWRRLVGRGPMEQLLADVSGTARRAEVDPAV